MSPPPRRLCWSPLRVSTLLVVLLLLGMAGCGEGEAASDDRSLSLASWRQRRCSQGECAANAPQDREETAEEEAPLWAVRLGNTPGSFLVHNISSARAFVLNPWEAVTISWVVRREEVARELARFGYEGPVAHATVQVLASDEPGASFPLGGGEWDARGERILTLSVSLPEGSVPGQRDRLSVALLLMGPQGQPIGRAVFTEDVTFLHQAKTEDQVVMVATPPRVGSTLLFNIARLLMQQIRPAVLSGYTSQKLDDLELSTPDDWRRLVALDTSVVVKTHSFESHLCAHVDFLLTARRPVPETICSFARLNADISQGRYSNEVELLVRTQLQEGRYLYRQVQECPANKVLVVRYTDLVRDLPGTLRRVADVLSRVSQGGERLPEAVLANVERLVRLMRPAATQASEAFLGPWGFHPITLLNPEHDRGAARARRDALKPGRSTPEAGPSSPEAGASGGRAAEKWRGEDAACARIHALVAEIAEQDPGVKAYVEWSAS